MEDEEILKKLEDTTVDATRRQLETLKTILEHNGGVRYLQPFLGQSDAPVDAEAFRRLVPLSTYDDYADHINRMADGADHYEDNDYHGHILSVDPLVCFFLSSGTSSMTPKLIPYFDSALSKAVSPLAHQVSTAVLRRLFSPRSPTNKILWFMYVGNVTISKGGFKAMAASAFPLLSNREGQSQFHSLCITPLEVIMGSNMQHQMYCHLLCGLRKFELIDGIRAPYAVGLISAFCLLESKWEQLCDDLQHGILNSEITDVEMRNSVTKFIGGPQPELSNRIRSVCKDKSWDGILCKLWPNARYIRCVTTGSMQQYYRKLKYYAGEMPLLCGDYFASECTVGINLDIMQPPELTRFVMLPTAAYFEFLPFNLKDACAIGKETRELSGVEVGKLYEVVVTTYRGLYRYRLGDIVRVVGFHNLSPLVEFVMRAPKSPSEILTERDLLTAIENLEFALGSMSMGEIMDFSSFLDLESSRKKVKIFVELKEGCMLLQKEKEQSKALLKSCCASFEEGLGGLYKARRETDEIESLLLSIVKPGTFDQLFQVTIDNDAPVSQYKPPKIIRSRKIANLMEGNAVLTVCLNSPDC
ncbi:hypothetical protein Nepgr_004499 [Nepenthes gracilis]|uniref:Indole-3-acetic acid-amido synthetase GH3.6 n=1 Tax=Nepenthes gracilis TaxID=150966 RepID=A0AAD3S1H6_NEPGR|nr:hypothetical protein Nepgr_004499 [Nepenthes gracilis]